ncbi:MAG: acetylglutamate kinase [Candidatus Fischerbacteria bacterium RBG_13_37_8]|uniref:acetylglutamate kinase n=1 Tax=Candidatus Fischerbacteria bacterium RBG_13_37_8 TaxID=1817863 RepID=A0A1F5VUL5_9BACT|nr:MAG: acetylglutamate kinase [Candidatus Fischerbacteria bacterium RBG_13_37_8]
MLIIKIGGGKEINIRGIIKDLSGMKEQFIIVHGANALRDELAERLAISKKIVTSVSGYSSVYSDETMIDLLFMAYAGLRNKRIVELCQQNGINAVGMTGVDGKMIQGKRNTGIRIREDEKLKIIRDFSGKPFHINMELLHLLLEHAYTPVLTIPIIDEQGHAINSENDDIIVVLQKEFKAGTVIHFIEAPGFLEKSDDPASVISHLNDSDIALWEEQAQGRFKRKLHAIHKLFENGTSTVIIADGRIEHPVNKALEGYGTIIQRSRYGKYN